MKYPKLWDGPNPVGEAKVRALQKVSAPFLSASGPGFSAAKMGALSEVFGGVSVEFASSGRVRRNGKEKDIVVTSTSHTLPFFAQGLAKTEDSNRRKLFTQRASSERYRQRRTYPSGDEVQLDGFIYQDEFFDARILSRRLQPVGVVEVSSIRIESPIGWVSVHRVGSISLVTQVAQKVPTYFTTFLADLGAVDEGGAPCPVPVFFVRTWGSEDTPDVFLLPTALLPNAIARRHEPTLAVVAGPGLIYVVDMAHWMYSSDHTTDVSARARLLFSTNGGNTWSVRDITDLLFDKALHPGHEEPEMLYAVMSAPPEAPGGGAWLPPLEDDFWTVTSSPRNRDTGLPAGASTSRVYLSNIQETAEGSNVYTYTKNTEFVFPHTASQQQDRIRNRLFTTAALEALLGGVVLMSVLHFDGDTSKTVGALYRFTPGAADRIWTSEVGVDFSYLQDMVHLGNNIVLAKRVFGYDTADADVKFELSVDGGMSFIEVAAAGLPPLRKNRFFGNFTLLEPHIDNDDLGLVILPAYDEAEMSYFVYESRDLGQSWERRGRLARTEQFYRVDSMLVGDGGGNFMDVVYFGTNQQPAVWNPSIPGMNEKF